MSPFTCVPRNPSVLALGIVFVFGTSFLAAQGGVRGPWDRAPRYYVSTTGSDANAGTRAAPWRSISHAASAVAPDLAAGYPVTINVDPGVYDESVESFPVVLPSRGLCIEANGPGAIVRNTSFASPAIFQVAVPGAGSGPLGTVPPSIIHGFEISGGSDGVHIQPSLLGGTAPADPAAVEVRHCDIHTCGFGVRVEVDSGWRDVSVVEACCIHECGLAGVAIFSSGESSTVIRSNRIFDTEGNIYVLNLGTALTCRPRIQSNFVWGGEFQVTLDACSPWMVNNTVAYARPHSLVPDTYGIIYNGSAPEVLSLANNILWNPAGATYNALDLQINGSPVEVIDTNDIEDASDPHVGTAGNISVPPGFVGPPSNLHLLASSPLIEAGNNAFVNPPLSLAAGTLSVRADLGVEGDPFFPRRLDFDKAGPLAVEIGADEVHVSMLAAAPADAFGNVFSAAAAPVTLTLTVTTRPFDRCGIFLWHRHSVDPVFMNQPRGFYGNLLIDLATPGDSNLIANGGSGASGVFTRTWTIDPSATGYESEWYLQAFATMTGSSRGDLTNRLRLEINPF